MPTAADAPFVTAIENNDELKRLCGGPSGKSEEFYRGSLSRPRNLWCLIVECLDTRAPIGRCGLMTPLFSDECEVHVILTKDRWGRGLGTEIAMALRDLAKEMFPQRCLTAKVHPKNDASLAIIANLGLAQHGTITSDSYDNGWLQFRESFRDERV